MRGTLMRAAVGAMAVGLLSAGAVAQVSPALRPDPPRIQAPREEFSLTRRQRKRMTLRAERRAVHVASLRRKLARRRVFLSADERERMALIDGMTNWQRNQWARDGYPKDLGTVRYFSGRVR